MSRKAKAAEAVAVEDPRQEFLVQIDPYPRIRIFAVNEDDARAQYRERTGIRRTDLVPMVTTVEG